MPISIAIKEDFKGIRDIWEEQFTTECDYLEIMFNQIMPLCTSYIYTEGRDILSVASFMPMKFIDTSRNIERAGWYMFGVATLKRAQGRKLAASIISNALSEFKSKNYCFVFERPANQSLNEYYLKLGFTTSIQRLPHLFSSMNTHCSTKNNTEIFPPQTILKEIRRGFPKRFEWENVDLLKGLVSLGEVQYHNNSSINSTKEKTYIAVNPLNEISPEEFHDTFFCFPME